MKQQHIKKILYSLVTLLTSMITYGQDFTATNGIEYTISGSEVSATGYTGNDTAIEIPNTVTNSGNTYTVTSIGNEAFMNKGLTSVTITDNVTSFGNNVFRDNQLTSVDIPESVTNIKYGAFKDNQLTSVTIHNTVTDIGTVAFDGNQLTSIDIPNSVTSIGRYTFRDNQLTHVTIPNSVTSIGEAAFLDNQLTSVTVLATTPPTLTSSDNIDVFFTNPNQIDLFVPDGTVAAYEAAAGWTGLKSYSISIVDDNALHFDGAEESYDNYVSIPSFSIDDEFTIEVWVKTTVDDEGMTIFYVGPNSGLGSVFGVNGTILYTEQDTRGGSGITNIADGNWHHVAVSRNTNTENNIKLYVDGIIESTFTKPSFDSYTTGYLGMLPVGGLIWEFDGSMDELRIWDYAKTQSQIQAQMLTKLTGTEDNLLAFYPFNQGNADEANPSETTLFDYSGNNNHGELQNFTLDGTTSNWVDGLDFTTLPEDAFVTEWDVEAGESITIPINDDYNYDFTVDWGDGSTSDIVTSNDDDDALTHDYINAGTYTVSITGDFPAIYFNDPFGNNATNSEKIQTVQQWGYTQWLSMWNAFAGCTNLDVYATDAPNLTVVTEMWGMFRNASSFTGQNTDLNSWDVSNVEKFSTLFTNSQFNADISNWNLQNADVSGGDFSDIFTNTSLDCSNYSAILIGWGENDNTASGNFILSGNDFYTASAATAVSNLVTNKGWIINGTEVTECPSLSINDEVFSNAISVSPNPVTSLLTINGPADFELKQATVYTIMGKQLLRTTNTTLNTSTLPSGLYILKIENTEGLIATKKIIKQ